MRPEPRPRRNRSATSMGSECIPPTSRSSSRRTPASWADVSLRGQADLHIIRVGRRLTYAFDAVSGSLLVSDDAAANWRAGRPPRPLIDLAVDPADDRHLLAATEEGVYRSRDRGADWRRVPSGRSGLLAWQRTGGRRLLSFAFDGTVWRNNDAGQTWRQIGDVEAAPTAATTHQREVYVATDDGAIRSSGDGGRTWDVRLRAPA